MNRAGWVVAGVLAIAVALMGYQLKTGQTKPTVEPAAETHGSHAKAGPGQVLEVWIDDLVLLEPLRKKEPKVYDIGVTVNVPQQQSVLWVSNRYEFKIIRLEPLNGGPQNPFFREFSAKTEQTDDWAKQVSSGPARREANPGEGKVFVYKATIKLRDGQVIDPHIMTGQGP
ncbi:MAG: hypothetical protein L0Z53_27295 [Acidobacteriales bacterium]|nr:hypothetical protein [Terriglobales bacterium]